MTTRGLSRSSHVHIWTCRFAILKHTIVTLPSFSLNGIVMHGDHLPIPPKRFHSKPHLTLPAGSWMKFLGLAQPMPQKKDWDSQCRWLQTLIVPSCWSSVKLHFYLFSVSVLYVVISSTKDRCDVNNTVDLYWVLVTFVMLQKLMVVSYAFCTPMPHVHFMSLGCCILMQGMHQNDLTLWKWWTFIRQQQKVKLMRYTGMLL